jgi:hypothetical protein
MTLCMVSLATSSCCRRVSIPSFKSSSDSLGDLSVRIRRFASERFSACDIDCSVTTPDCAEVTRGVAQA